MQAKRFPSTLPRRMPVDVRALDALDVAVCLLDGDLRIGYANPAFERLTGWSAEEATGKSWKLLRGERTDAAALTALQTAVTAGEPCRAALYAYRRDGGTFLTDLSLAPVRSDDGDIEAYALAFVDGT